MLMHGMSSTSIAVHSMAKNADRHDPAGDGVYRSRKNRYRYPSDSTWVNVQGGGWCNLLKLHISSYSQLTSYAYTQITKTEQDEIASPTDRGSKETTSPIPPSIDDSRTSSISESGFDPAARTEADGWYTLVIDVYSYELDVGS